MSIEISRQTRKRTAISINTRWAFEALRQNCAVRTPSVWSRHGRRLPLALLLTRNTMPSTQPDLQIIDITQSQIKTFTDKSINVIDCHPARGEIPLASLWDGYITKKGKSKKELALQTDKRNVWQFVDEFSRLYRPQVKSKPCFSDAIDRISTNFNMKAIVYFVPQKITLRFVVIVCRHLKSFIKILQHAAMKAYYIDDGCLVTLPYFLLKILLWCNLITRLDLWRAITCSN